MNSKSHAQSKYLEPYTMSADGNMIHAGFLMCKLEHNGTIPKGVSAVLVKSSPL